MRKNANRVRTGRDPKGVASRRAKWPVVKPLGSVWLLFIFLLSGCASVDPVVKIGLVAPFEGQNRAVGYDVIYSARLAVREINEAGGIGGYRVALVALDDSSDPTLAAQTAHALVEHTGGSIFVLSGRNRHPLRYMRALTKLVRERAIQIVHAHGNSATLTAELIAGKRGGARVISDLRPARHEILLIIVYAKAKFDNLRPEFLLQLKARAHGKR